MIRKKPAKRADPAKQGDFPHGRSLLLHPFCCYVGFIHNCLKWPHAARFPHTPSSAAARRMRAVVYPAISNYFLHSCKSGNRYQPYLVFEVFRFNQAFSAVLDLLRISDIHPRTSKISEFLLMSSNHLCLDLLIGHRPIGFPFRIRRFSEWTPYLQVPNLNCCRTLIRLWVSTRYIIRLLPGRAI